MFVWIYIHICTTFFPVREDFCSLKWQKKMGWAQNLLQYGTILGLSQMYATANDVKGTSLWIFIYLGCLLARKLTLKNATMKLKNLWNRSFIILKLKRGYCLLASCSIYHAPSKRRPLLLFTWKSVLAPCSRAGLRGATGLRVLQKWMLESKGLGVSKMGVCNTQSKNSP